MNPAARSAGPTVCEEALARGGVRVGRRVPRDRAPAQVPRLGLVHVVEHHAVPGRRTQVGQDVRQPGLLVRGVADVHLPRAGEVAELDPRAGRVPQEPVGPVRVRPAVADPGGELRVVDSAVARVREAGRGVLVDEHLEPRARALQLRDEPRLPRVQDDVRVPARGRESVVGATAADAERRRRRRPLHCRDAARILRPAEQRQRECEGGEEGEALAAGQAGHSLKTRRSFCLRIDAQPHGRNTRSSEAEIRSARRRARPSR